MPSDVSRETQELTVVCVYKSGIFDNLGLGPGRKPYTADDVATLQAMVQANVKVPFRFVCFSDSEVPCERIPLKHNWPGWWSKMELFSHVFQGPVVYLDLDLVIMGDVTEMFTFPHKFTMMQSISGPNIYSSAFMGWNGDFSHLYLKFKQDPEKFQFQYKDTAKIGDQAFIQDNQQVFDLIQDHFPNQIDYCSMNYLRFHYPDLKIIFFCGRYKGRESVGKIREVWDKYAVKKGIDSNGSHI